MSLCPLTKKEVSQPFLVRHGVPTNQNKLYDTALAARTMPRGTLELYVCPDTGFIWNGAFAIELVDYGILYENTQTASASFREHLHTLCKKLVEEEHIRQCHIVEIGCGKGDFIKQLIEYPGGENTGDGYDTSYVGPESMNNGRLRFHQSYYGPGNNASNADVIICRHVIEHIHDPLHFLTQLRQAIGQQGRVRLFFETFTVEWILRNQVFFDFFYEHCSYFTPSSLATAFQRAGFGVEGVDLVFGNQYQWLKARADSTSPIITTSPGEIVTLAHEYAEKERLFIEKAVGRLQSLRAQQKKIAVWGAGAKGVTLCNLLDPSGEIIDCILDINPEKQGKFLPGTGHPIFAPTAVNERNIHVVVGMNPNYYHEHTSLLTELRPQASLIYLCPPYPHSYEDHD